MVLAPEREAGLQCLKEFLPCVRDYAGQRNHDRPGELTTSGLSPYIRYRLIREREVVSAVLAENAYAGSGKFIEEVCWRTYWKGYLEVRPAIWSNYCKQVRNLPGALSAAQRESWSLARAGKTGIDCFDAWTHQLTTTGWLHNHAPSNTLSWRWVAGLHTEGKHYLATAENIQRYTDGRHYPHGMLNEDAAPIPVDGPWLPGPLPKVSPVSDASLPSLSCCPAGLLVTPDDLCPESGELGETPFSSICVFNAGDVMDRIYASSRVREFINGAVEDTAGRLSRHWGADTRVHKDSVQRVPSVATPSHVGRREPLRVHTGTLANWVDGVVTWAENENLKSVWLLQPPVGPWQDRMAALRALLRTRDIRLFEFRRTWDASHWPWARAGYFRFRKGLQDRIGELLRGG
jgi:hypothetical protein